LIEILRLRNNSTLLAAESEEIKVAHNLRNLCSHLPVSSQGQCYTKKMACENKKQKRRKKIFELSNSLRHASYFISLFSQLCYRTSHTAGIAMLVANVSIVLVDTFTMFFLYKCKEVLITLRR
jgi:hypothetical protein